MTLQAWGDSNNAPLKITVQDKNDQNPFSLAVLRGHYDVARAIVEISYAQYQPPEEEKPKRYRLGDEGDDDSASETSDVPVYQEIVDDKFTIDNIGELSTQVKSSTSPLSFMSWNCSAWSYAQFVLDDKKFTCGVDEREIEAKTYSSWDSSIRTSVQRKNTLTLQSWSITTNDKTLFSFLLDLDIEWTDRLANKLDGSSGIPSFALFDFKLALEYGRIELLAEMIKHGGAGMELESLVKKSGVKYREKPKFYQGLSVSCSQEPTAFPICSLSFQVHGKKRADWVSAARGTITEGVADTSPPLLLAAFYGSLQSVEWLLSDTPARHYLDFAEAYKNDKFITHLNTKAGGFEKVLRKWLDARRKSIPYRLR